MQQRSRIRENVINDRAESKTNGAEAELYQDLMEEIQTGIQQLSPTQRIVLNLFYLENLGLQDISELLDVSIAIIQSVFIIIFVIAAVYCGYRFFTVETITEMLRYGAGMFIFLMFTAFLKLWLWNQMDKLSIFREMKRIEFQVVILLEKISGR